MLKSTKIFVLILTILSCGQGKMNTPQNVSIKFEAFKNKEKFIEDLSLFYPGIGDKKMRPIYTKMINLAADDFAEIAKKENPSAKGYHKKIQIGLARFSSLKLSIDTEDRERICAYFEELMDIVGLESSEGQLNQFMYEF